MPSLSPYVQSDLETEHKALYISDYEHGYNLIGILKRYCCSCKSFLCHFWGSCQRWINNSGALIGAPIKWRGLSQGYPQKCFQVGCRALWGWIRWAIGPREGNLRASLCIKLSLERKSPSVMFNSRSLIEPLICLHVTADGQVSWEET